MQAPSDTIRHEREGRGPTAMGCLCSWKDIPGWEGRFQINLAGEVRSVPRVEETLRSGTRGAKTHRVKGTVLKPRVIDGRKWIALQAGTKRLSAFRSVSSLLMLTFVGPRPDGLEVCHNDGNCANDALHNLRYDTPLANAADRKLHGTHYVGSQTTQAKLVESEIPHIRRAIASGESFNNIAKRFGLKCARSIYQISRGETWRHVP